jgi:hypothetical protein
VYLDCLTTANLHVCDGSLGVRDKLGYEGKKILGGGELYGLTISGHVSSRIDFNLGGRLCQLKRIVVIDDDVPCDASTIN